MTLLDLAREHRRSGRYAEAAQLLQQAVAESPMDPELWFQGGTLAIKLREFAFAQTQVVAQLQAVGQTMQGFLTDQVGAQARHVTFSQLAIETLKQRDGGNAVENAVAEELEPFVVGRAETAMSERLLKEFQPGKAMADGPLQDVQLHENT